MKNSPLPQSTSAFLAPDGMAARTATPSSAGISWSAIFAGAAGAAVLSLVLLLLGAGVGFSVVSPWSDHGVSATTVGISTIVWMTVIQILASVMGGYLAGRLRAKWGSLDSHEAYFRDTAHGFLAWAVATLVTASLLSSAVGSIAGVGLKTGAAVTGGAATLAGAGAAGLEGNAATNPGNSDAATNPGNSDPLGYFTDTMFRPVPGQVTSAPSSIAPTPSAEVGRIFTTSLKNGALSPTDSQYLAQLVASRTGLSADDAQKRVTDTFVQAQQNIQEAKSRAQAAADAARKASAALALWLVVSLLLGAFTASWAATFGGRLRDGLDTVTR